MEIFISWYAAIKVIFGEKTIILFFKSILFHPETIYKEKKNKYSKWH